MSGLDIALAVLSGPALVAAGWLAGRSDTRLGVRGRLDKAYDRGWDESALTAASGRPAELSSGRGAAGDGPALPPGQCPGGRRCVRGPEPHQWSADCEEDEGWDSEVKSTPDDDWADTLGAMRRELSAEAERPASHTDQFSAIFSRADGLERQVMLTWDAGRRFDRGRPEYLRSMGISDKRIRELLGAD